ncbi:MAG: hypothetical protein NC489_35395, partial [Ruminococcus flavefaciens]|nr:hypothetical protein [Ruminococcus flavefaciens]
MKEKPNMDNPVLYTEKIQYRKIYEHDSVYTKLADKVAVRDYIEEILDGEMRAGIIKFPVIYGIYENP